MTSEVIKNHKRSLLSLEPLHLEMCSALLWMGSMLMHLLLHLVTLLWQLACLVLLVSSHPLSKMSLVTVPIYLKPNYPLSIDAGQARDIPGHCPTATARAPSRRTLRHTIWSKLWCPSPWCTKALSQPFWLKNWARSFPEVGV